ncbi:MAG: 4'-phosphopantetheinyl transferase superfamily protein [Psychroserpens sp.]|uniref:4'-phosphopantetheinyl transferase family protein n=1 Tax=Psychroserpens sp. TaxID=2020870 RepID=UPI003C711895
MPLYKTIHVNSQTVVKIWKITESYNDLYRPLQLKPNSLERVLGMKSELHQRGFLSVRYLLREFGYTDQDLFYDDYGKPHLKDGKQISITHSFTFSGVIISSSEVGIDIEKQRDKIAVIAKKFVDYEFNYLAEDDDEYVKKLTVIWGIKESLYKLFATPGMLFKAHFLVIPFMLDDGETVAWIDYKNKKYRYNSHFLEFEGFTCAYVVA